MAENYKNIENLNKLTADRVPELKKKLDATERAVADLLKKLGSVEAAIQTRKAVAAEEAERAARVAEGSSASAASSAPATSAAPAASAEPTAFAASAAKESVEASGKTASAAHVEETAAPINTDVFEIVTAIGFLEKPAVHFLFFLFIQKEFFYCWNQR